MVLEELSDWRKMPLELWPIEVLRAEVERMHAENAAFRSLVEWIAAELPDYDATVKMHEQARKILGLDNE